MKGSKIPYLAALPKNDYIIVDLDTGTVIGINTRILRVKQGNRVILNLDNMSESDIIDWAKNHGAKPRAFAFDLIESESR